MNKLTLSKKRYQKSNHIKDKYEYNYHDSFHRDYDKIIFSNAFRRLSRKTQVHPLSKNDHVHNRLTHSLEVASVGRALGLYAGEIIRKKQKGKKEIDKDIFSFSDDVAFIVQSACLAHDIGNPPFGHAGEDVIKEWFKANKDSKYLKELSENDLNDFIHLDGNAQSFRTVTQLENNLFSGGLNLTFETLATLVKYPYSSQECIKTGKSKFNFFQSELDYAKEIFTELGLMKKDGSFKRHCFSYLMEAADDICYGFLDLQDAVELEMISIKELKPIFENIIDSVELDKICNDQNLLDIQKTSKLVSQAIEILMYHAMEKFEKNLEEILSDDQPEELLKLFDQNYLRSIKSAKQFAKESIRTQHSKVTIELGAYNIIETILNTLIPATYELYKVSDESQLKYKDERALLFMKDYRPIKTNSLYNMYQRVIDYIMGMTDNQAVDVANSFNGFIVK